MRKIELHTYITPDGRTEFPDYPGSEETEMNPGPAFTDKCARHYDSIGTIIPGRSACEDRQSFWSRAKHRDTEPGFYLDFRRYLDRSQKKVLSRSLMHVDWHESRIMKRGLSEAVGLPKTEPGKNIATGGGSMLAGAFIQRGLFDKYFLKQQTLKLVESRAFKSGELFLHYATVREKNINEMNCRIARGMEGGNS